MSIDMQKVINYMVELKNRGIKYSMTGSRDGSDGTGDCSGTLVRGMEKAGLPIGWLYNTDSMHAWLRKNGFKAVFEGYGNYTPKKGDIFVWGKEGQSGGAFGHTGIFYDDNENIIHCNYGYNGVTINNVDVIWNANGQPYYYIYRQTGSSNPTPTPQPPKPTGKRRYGYKVDDVQFVNGFWQIRNNHLCNAGFTWTDNGIPASDVDMIDPNTGAMLADQQTINKGQYFAFNPNKVRYVGAVVKDGGRTFRSVKTSQGIIWVEYRTSQDQLIYGVL